MKHHVVSILALSSLLAAGCGGVLCGGEGSGVSCSPATSNVESAVSKMVLVERIIAPTLPTFERDLRARPRSVTFPTGQVDLRAPLLQSGPKDINFLSTVGEEGPKTQTLLLRSVGNGPVRILDINIKETQGRSAFTYFVKPNVVTILPDSPVSLIVSFAPGVAGTYRAVLTVRTDAANAESIAMDLVGFKHSKTVMFAEGQNTLRAISDLRNNAGTKRTTRADRLPVSEIEAERVPVPIRVPTK